MGRRERPVDPARGPVQRFAYELRKLRDEAGGPTTGTPPSAGASSAAKRGGLTYRQLAARCEFSVTTLSQAAAGERLPSLPVTLAYVAACGGDPGEWERRWHAVSAQEAGRTRDDEEETAEPPYRGLARFEPGDQDLFFGRTALTAELLGLVRAHRFAAVFGPSGSGKSSLLRAGLIPLLRAGDAPGPRPAAVRVLTPGEHPARTHEAALTPVEGEGETWVLVDQFEEVFTLCRDPAERARFLDLLLQARDTDRPVEADRPRDSDRSGDSDPPPEADPPRDSPRGRGRLRVVIAVRADFYGRCAEHRALTEALRDAHLLVGPMTHAELREAIVGPATAHGLIVERALTARLLAEAGSEPGALPLLSHVLLETWRRRKGRTLTLEAYEAAGGVRGAVAQTAEDVHARLTLDQAILARRILLRLIAPGEGSQDTRRPAARSELDFAHTRADTGHVLERLAAARLLTLDDDSVDLAHEALLTSWPRLRGWIEEGRERLRAQRRLTEAARAWDAWDRDPGALYRGSRLAEADEQFGDGRRRSTPRMADLTPGEREFLAASRRARLRERRRLGGGAAALCALLVLALLAGVIAWQQTRTNERQHTESEARRVAAVADSMRMSDPVRAMRLSAAAWRLADTPETRSALLGALTQPEEDSFTLPNGPGNDADADRVLSADGRTLVSAGDGRLTRWDVPAHRRRGTAPGAGGGTPHSAPLAPVLSPDAGTLATTDQKSRIALRRVTDGRVRRLPGATGTPLGFSPAGRLLQVDASTEGRGGSGAHPSVQLWDARRARKVFERKLRDDQSVDGSVSHDESTAALCPGGAPLELWHVDRHRAGGDHPLPLGAWPAKARRDVCRGEQLTFAPGDKSLVALDDSGIRAWDLRTGRARTLAKKNSLTDMRLSEDGRLVVATDSQEILAWRTDVSRRPVLRYPLVSEYVSGLAVDTRAGVVRYLSGFTGHVVRTLSLSGAHRAHWRGKALDHAAFSSDGRHLATARLRPPRATFRLHDGHTGAVTRRLPPLPCRTEPGSDEGRDGGTGIACTPLTAFSGEGGTFAYGTSQWGPRGGVGDRVSLWDLRRHRVLRELRLRPPGGAAGGAGAANDLNGLSLTPDGRSLLASRIPEKERLEVWDTRTGRRTKVLPGAGGEALSVSPHGDLVVTSHGQLVSPRTGEVVRRALTQDETDAVAHSPDGRYLAAGDDSGRVTLWDGRGRRSLGMLAGTYREGAGGRPEPVSALAFSPDGSTLAVAGAEGTLRLWDTGSHQPLGGPLPTGRDHTLALAFSPDGGTVYAAGARTRVRGFVADPHRAVRKVCARASGGLSPAQWRAALPTVPYRSTCP